MANASARRSFHGPLQTPPPVRRESFVPTPIPARPLDVVPAPPSLSALGRAVLRARSDSPSTSERERMLAGVLAALQGLTGAHR